MRALLRALVTWTALALATPAAGAGLSVLLLQQDDETWPAYQAFFGGFRESLARAHGADLVIYRENLDLSRFPDPAYRDALRRWYAAKYQAVDLGAIVALGPASVSFLALSRRELWRGVPVIVAGGDAPAMAALLDGPVSAVGLVPDTTGTIELARRLFPAARRLALVGERDLRLSYFPDYDRRVAAAAQGLELVDLRGLPMAELLERVDALPADSILHFSALALDGDGQRFIPREVLARLAARSRAPAFGDLDSYLDTGAMGGSVTDIRAFGAAVGNRVVAVLASPNVPPPSANAAWAAPVVDWRALERFGVPERRVPRGTEIRFRSPGAWELYGREILAVGAAFALLLLLLARLLHERRQRMAAESEARARMTELGRANRISAANELAAAIAHDLGQPLAAIQSNLDSLELLLDAGPRRAAELREVLAHLRADDQRAAEVLDRLRSLYRNSPPREERVPVDALLRDVTLMASGLARRRSIVISARPAHGDLHVRADAVQLQQVLINLVLNALDAIPPHAPRRQVAIAARRVGDGRVRLAVEDSGPGVPDEARERVFEPFYTTKDNGTGMGLAIVKRIAESWGAVVRVGRSALGGAEFSFELPEADA